MKFGCEYIFTDAMRGLTTIHPAMHGHINVLAETQRPKAAIVVTDSILCFLNGKRSRTAYEPVEEFKLAFGTDWDYVEVKIIWGADLPLIREYARVNAKAQLRMRDPDRDTPRIFGIIRWNGKELVGRDGLTDFVSSWRHECAHPDRFGTEARILGNVRRLAQRKTISDEFICICGIESYINELPSFVDDFWKDIFDVIKGLDIPRFRPDNLVFMSDRVDQWHLRKTQENVDKFVIVSTVKLFYHANVVNASREGIAALNRVQRFKYNWEASGGGPQVLRKG